MAEETKKKSGRVGKFFRDYKSEFKKIVWPSWNDTVRMSAVVIVAIVVSSAVLLGLDTACSKALQWLGGLI